MEQILQPQRSRRRRSRNVFNVQLRVRGLTLSLAAVVHTCAFCPDNWPAIALQGPPIWGVMEQIGPLTHQSHTQPLDPFRFHVHVCVCVWEMWQQRDTCPLGFHDKKLNLSKPLTRLARQFFSLSQSRRGKSAACPNKTPENTPAVKIRDLQKAFFCVCVQFSCIY